MTGSKLREASRFVLGIAALLGAAACGDPETMDERGYTKAPLENPAISIQGESTTEMDRLGDPIRPRVVELQLTDTTAAAAPAPQS